MVNIATPLSIFAASLLTITAAIADQSLGADNTLWAEYYRQSERLKEQDQIVLANELQAQQLSSPISAIAVNRFIVPAQAPPQEYPQENGWYQSEQAKIIANNVLSFQTASGGWSKRTDMINARRQVGQAFGSEKNYIPTFDNGATSDQINFLVKIYAAAKDQKYLHAIERAITLILGAQYPNGCWPQTYPLVGDYHDHVTFNDKVMVNLLSVLHQYTNKADDYATLANSSNFPQLQQRSESAIKKGLGCILASQVEINGELTVWGAQHDVETLKPAPARAYEMASLASQESLEIIEFLMAYVVHSEDFDTEIINAVDKAIEWFNASKIGGYRWRREGDEVAELIEDVNGPILWSRFYELGSNKPVFGDRDGAVHYDVNDISLERRLRYRWFTESPGRLTRKYKQWREKIAQHQ